MPWLHRFVPSALILLFHRVASRVFDPQLLCVAPENFRAQVDYLRQHYTLLGLSELVQAIAARAVPRRSVVITFDDGFADNFHYARPILEQTRTPATIFVTSGFVGQSCELWSDRLEQFLFTPELLGDSLSVRCGDDVWHWELGGCPASLSAWDVTQSQFPSPRHRCYAELSARLRRLSALQRFEIFAQLVAQARRPEQIRDERRLLASAEIRALAESGLFTIGSHGVNHISLGAQDREAQYDELVASRRTLAAMTGRDVTLFAYPYGGPGDYTQLSMQLAREAGYTAACANEEGVVWSGSDMFRLPRLLVRNWTVDELRRHL
jgi:peptidoglycan/xylan/chitin deacetylase (PgdA/CDA1 family)